MHRSSDPSPGQSRFLPGARLSEGAKSIPLGHPIQDQKIVRHICDDVLGVYFADTAKSRQMLASGAYVRRKPADGKRPVNAQEWLLKNNRKATGRARLVRSRLEP